jgi:hypothetical protein
MRIIHKYVAIATYIKWDILIYLLIILLQRKLQLDMSQLSDCYTEKFVLAEISNIRNNFYPNAFRKVI